MKKLYILKERNSWEREVWNFFVRMADEQAQGVRDHIANDSSYSLTESDLSEAQVAERVSRSTCRGYMPAWNDAGEMQSLPEPGVEDPFYKGGISRYCNTPGEAGKGTPHA